MVAAADRSVRQLADSLEVRWPGGDVTTLPYLWLRDNCGCDDCRVAQTSEKRFLISSVSVDLAPASAVLEDEALKITWPDGHETRYVVGDVLRPSPADPIGRVTWPADYRPVRSDFESFLGDDSVAAGAIATFLEDGAVILERAPTTPGTLEALSPRLGPVREVLFARIHDVQVDPRGYNVAHTPLDLPPHNDFASYTWPPSVQALHMLANDVSGGESVIVDGIRILDSLRLERPSLFEALVAMPVPFREFDELTETHAVEPLVRLDCDGNVTGLRFSNQLMQAIDPTRPNAATFYRAYHELCLRVLDDANQVEFRLEAGDILVVDAHRILHGRRAFTPDGRRHLQDAYFELDNIRNELVVLRRGGRQ